MEACTRVEDLGVDEAAVFPTMTVGSFYTDLHDRRSGDEGEL